MRARRSIFITLALVALAMTSCGSAAPPPSPVPAPTRAPLLLRPGMIVEGGPVVAAFDRIGWAWGGRWSAPLDLQTGG